MPLDLTVTLPDFPLCSLFSWPLPSACLRGILGPSWVPSAPGASRAPRPRTEAEDLPCPWLCPRTWAALCPLAGCSHMSHELGFKVIIIQLPGVDAGAQGKAGTSQSRQATTSGRPSTREVFPRSEVHLCWEPGAQMLDSQAARLPATSASPPCPRRPPRDTEPRKTGGGGRGGKGSTSLREHAGGSQTARGQLTAALRKTEKRKPM